jgi:pyruvate,orthophosphate dikinase
VVAGIRTPQYLTKAARERAGAKPLSMEEAMPQAYAELAAVFELLEKHYRDMQDIEFTVEKNKLWMLQTRSGKRTAKAALKMAVDMVGEGLIDEATAIAASIPWRSTSCCTPRSIPRRRAMCWPRACRPRPARPAAPWCSMPIRRRRAPNVATA